MMQDSIKQPEQAKPLKDRKEETAANINRYVARIRAKKLNRTYYLDDLQELYTNFHELFYLTKQQMVSSKTQYGKRDLTTCVNEWLNLPDIKNDIDYGLRLSLSYLDALIVKGVLKP